MFLKSDFSTGVFLGILENAEFEYIFDLKVKIKDGELAPSYTARRRLSEQKQLN